VTVIHVAEMTATLTLCGMPHPLPDGHRVAVYGAPVVRVTCETCKEEAAALYAKGHR
jgi:hypothetical protein